MYARRSSVSCYELEIMDRYSVLSYLDDNLYLSTYVGTCTNIYNQYHLSVLLPVTHPDLAGEGTSEEMFGIDDPWIWSSYFVGIAGVLFCVIYGWLNRNEGEERW